MNRKPFKFAIRDHVRISRDKGVPCERIHSEVVGRTFRHRIPSCVKTPNVYVIRDLSGETLQGVFMKNDCKGLELQTSSPFLVLYENRV